jgi:lysophospholipase L1-like esterase
MKQLYEKLRKDYEMNPATYPCHRWSEAWWKQRWDAKMKEMNTPEAAKAKVVFLGDSITQGWEEEGKAEWQEHFAPLGALNWGFSGDRTEHLIWRLQNGDTQRVNPEVAVLLIGTNNTGQSKQAAEESAVGIKHIVDDLAWKWPNTKVILMSIFPRSATPDDPLRQLNDQLNQLIKPLADGKRVHWLDINAKFLDANGNLSKDFMPDLLHLSPASYAIWADELSAKFKELGIK